jgi:Fic family protein
MHDTLPNTVKRFIVLHIDSVELLNVLLILHREPNRQFTIENIEHELRSSRLAIEKRLSDLYSRKILRKISSTSGLHSYLPTSAEISTEIADVAAFNQTYPARIIELIYSRKDEALRSFADAFKIKEDK